MTTSVAARKRWLEEAKIEAGPVLRRIAQAGLDPVQFSAHGLRSGYLTEAANAGIPLPEAMQQSLHKSVTQASGYDNNTERKMARAARLVL
jgi:integrase